MAKSAHRRPIAAWSDGAATCALAGLFLLASCAGGRTVETRQPVDLAWPDVGTRVRLESIIDLERRAEGAGGKLLRWMGEQRSSERLNRPFGVAWDGSDLLVTDPDGGRVVRIPARGKLRFSPDGLFSQPVGVAVCAAGIVVSDAAAGRLALLDEELGLIRWIASDLSRPTGLACGEEAIYVTETGRHRLLVVGPDGSSRSLGRRGGEPGEFNFPTAIATDGGQLLVGDTLNFRLQLVDPEDAGSRAWSGRLGDAPGEMPRIKGLAIDPAGHVWVSDGHLDYVSIYSHEGELLMTIGGTGSGDGQFSFPAGIAVHEDGRVAVVDSLNRRLQIFRVLAREPGHPGSG